MVEVGIDAVKHIRDAIQYLHFIGVLLRVSRLF